MNEYETEGLILLGNQELIVWSNPRASQLLHISVNDYYQQSIMQVLSPNEVSCLIRGKSFIKTIERRDAQQSEQIISLQLMPFISNQKLVIIQDITRNQRLDKMRRDFIANASHELRTPLTVFRGYLEVMSNQPTISEQQLLKIVKDMSGQAERMERLVEDLLLLSHLESEQPDISHHQPVAVSALLNDICHDAKTISAGKHHFIIELDQELELMGNADELASAFSNLIYNAVQYTPVNGKICIRWFKDSRGMHMQVQDSGIGIDQKYISRITQRFYRVDKSRSYRGIGGTGLGLAIVKHVLLRHHGHLHINSELGKGSVFSCQFDCV